MNRNRRPKTLMRLRQCASAIFMLALTLVCSGLFEAEAQTVRVRADDESQIQRAIDKLPAGGGKVVISADSPVSIRKSLIIARDNVTLEGESANVVLRLAINANAPVIIIGEDTAVPLITHKNIHVRFLVIDGNRTNQTTEIDSKNPALRNND